MTKTNKKQKAGDQKPAFSKKNDFKKKAAFQIFKESIKEDGKTVSIRDTFVKKPTKENFYHGLLLGILGFKENWSVMSNRESGDGFSDILIRIEDEDVGIVIEV